MSAMERSIDSRPGDVGQSEIGRHRTQTSTGTYERDPQIRSLITPGLVSVPSVPAWLRKLFRRKDAPAVR